MVASAIKKGTAKWVVLFVTLKTSQMPAATSFHLLFSIVDKKCLSKWQKCLSCGWLMHLRFQYGKEFECFEIRHSMFVLFLHCLSLLPMEMVFNWWRYLNFFEKVVEIYKQYIQPLACIVLVLDLNLKYANIKNIKLPCITCFRLQKAQLIHWD